MATDSLRPATGRVVSVITAVHAPAAGFLATAYASLAAQVLPPGWSWEWLIQEDGPGVGAAAVVPRDPRICVSQARRSGPASARNLALAVATGEIVQNLDADDQLLPGALARVITVLSASPDVGWTTATALDLLPDGSRRAVAGPPPGRLPRGRLLDLWRAGDCRPPVHPASLAARRDALVLLGGWTALPASEDTALLLALSATGDGWFIDEPGLLYRKWPGQLTNHPAHVVGPELTARHRLLEERATLLAGGARVRSAAT